MTRDHGRSLIQDRPDQTLLISSGRQHGDASGWRDLVVDLMKREVEAVVQTITKTVHRPPTVLQRPGPWDRDHNSRYPNEDPLGRMAHATSTSSSL